MGTAEGWSLWSEWWSSGQKKTTWDGWVGYFEDEFGGWSYWLGGGVTLRPGGRIQLSLNPRWNHRVNSRQYIDTFDGGGPETYGSRYVFSYIERSQLVVQTRLSLSSFRQLSSSLMTTASRTRAR